MTVLAADKQMENRKGDNRKASVGIDILYANGMICYKTSDGYAYPGADTSGYVFAGIAQEQIDNSDGSAGDLDIELRSTGEFLMIVDTPLLQAQVGTKVYIVDDNTVDLVGNVTNNIFAGIITYFVTTTLVWVDITTATLQTDVATHISDASGAHAASAIDATDAGTYFASTAVEGILQEIGANIETTQAFIPLPLTSFRETTNMDVGTLTNNGGILASNTTPLMDAISAAADGCQRLVWAASNVDQIMIQVALPPDRAETTDVVLHTRIKSASTTDAVGFTLASYWNESNGAVADTSSTNQTATYLEKLTTIAAADIATAAQTVSLGLTPVAHNTDALHMSSGWLEYTRKILTS